MLAFMASMICGPALGQDPKAQRGAVCFRHTALSATPSVGLRQVHSVSRHLSESCTSGIRSRILPSRLRKALHPTMPEFRFDPAQIGNVIAYLKTLERQPQPQ